MWGVDFIVYSLGVCERNIDISLVYKFNGIFGCRLFSYLMYSNRNKGVSFLLVNIVFLSYFL